MEISTLAKMDRASQIVAYKHLSMAMKPIFSGSVDHRINLLDPRKVQSLIDLGPERRKQLIGKGSDLLEELEHKLDLLKNKRIFHGYWDCINDVKGCLPEARKGASMNIIGSEIFVFGGFSRDTYNDLKVFDVTTCKWREVETS